jgi:hypothetical protein
LQVYPVKGLGQDARQRRVDFVTRWFSTWFRHKARPGDWGTMGINRNETTPRRLPGSEFPFMRCHSQAVLDQFIPKGCVSKAQNRNVIQHVKGR